MGISSSKSSSVDSKFKTSKRITQTKRRRNYSDTTDVTTKAALSQIPQSIFSETNDAAPLAPPPYSATTGILPDVTKHSRNAYVSGSESARYVSLDPTNRQAGVTTPLALGSQHTQIYMFPAGAGPTQNVEYLRKPMRRESVENALEILRKYDTVVIVDDSSSMEGALWNEARDALASLADIAGEYDADGIDIHFLNATRFMSTVHQSSTINQLFDKVRPRGITPIGKKLEELLLVYLENLESAKERELAGNVNAAKAIKPVNYIILTDGVPTDDPEDVIIAAARRLDRGNFSVTQVGIQFVQIGNSKTAANYLRELDDGLSANHGVRDIVDTTPYIGKLNAEILTKILLGGINRRIDRKGGGSVMS